MSFDILSDQDMQKLERDVTKLEKLAKRKQAAKGGIYSKKGQEALPSSIIKNQKRSIDSGLYKGRAEESKQKLLDDEIRSQTEEKVNKTQSIMNALGISKNSKQTSPTEVG